jgi:hypothetical protein
MTILEAIEDANTAAGIDYFSFANIKEFQSFMDSFEYAEYPRNIVVPFTLSGNYNTNTFNMKSSVNLQGWIIRRIPEDTNDWRSSAVETSYLEPIRALAKQFIAELIKTPIVDNETQSISFSIKPEYAFLNAHLFGVSYTVNLPVVKNVC